MPCNDDTMKKVDTYCLCDVACEDPAAFEGAMVQCGRERECPMGEWFHYSCIDQEPTWTPPDDWKCFKCRLKGRIST